MTKPKCLSSNMATTESGEGHKASSKHSTLRTPGEFCETLLWYIFTEVVYAHFV